MPRTEPHPTDPAPDGQDPEPARLLERVLELEDQVAARDEVISTLAHELRNPLTPVVLLAEALKIEVARAPGGTVTAEWLEPRLARFVDRVERLLAVLDRLLDASALAGGPPALVLGEVDLAEVARDSVADLSAEVAAARCEVTVDAAAPVVGHWDPVRVRQIVSNLVTNAARYGAGAPIHVRVSESHGVAELSVRDHGIGIAPDDLERIFERYERASRSTGGLGLGLWLVRQLCEAMGGSVRVDSRPGEGATFVVTLPCRTATEGNLT